ncbi:MAG: MoxR family ATPase [Verrucomicrobiota bacterium]
MPEAQMDRFMFKVIVGYPTEEEERVILDRMSSTKPVFTLNSIVTPEEIVKLQTLVNDIYVDDQVKNYIIKLVLATRNGEKLQPGLGRMIRCGSSPRATINLNLAARAHAMLQGQAFVTPDNVKAIAPEVLRHRILLTYEAEAEDVTQDSIVQTILGKVLVP